jgi:hypothetical protein
MSSLLKRKQEHVWKAGKKVAVGSLTEAEKARILMAQQDWEKLNAKGKLRKKEAAEKNKRSAKF